MRLLLTKSEILPHCLMDNVLGVLQLLQMICVDILITDYVLLKKECIFGSDRSPRSADLGSMCVCVSVCPLYALRGNSRGNSSGNFNTNKPDAQG